MEIILIMGIISDLLFLLLALRFKRIFTFQQPLIVLHVFNL